VGAGDGITGWYGALDYDGNGGGSNEYDENIVDGEVDTTYCAEGSFSDPCPGTVTVDALTGNKVGGTGSGIDERLAAGPACDNNGNGRDDFDEVFDTDPSGINSYIVVCPASPNVVVIPIVTHNGQIPVHEVTILGWTLAYLDYYGCSSASAIPIGGGDFVFAYDDVRVVASETCEKKAPRNTAMIVPEVLPIPPACLCRVGRRRDRRRLPVTRGLPTARSSVQQPPLPRHPGHRRQARRRRRAAVPAMVRATGKST
jgi:hypothetical protein